jgi:hypothetical protein
MCKQRDMEAASDWPMRGLTAITMSSAGNTLRLEIQEIEFLNLDRLRSWRVTEIREYTVTSAVLYHKVHDIAMRP